MLSKERIRKVQYTKWTEGQYNKQGDTTDKTDAIYRKEASTLSLYCSTQRNSIWKAGGKCLGCVEGLKTEAARQNNESEERNVGSAVPIL